MCCLNDTVLHVAQCCNDDSKSRLWMMVSIETNGVLAHCRNFRKNMRNSTLGSNMYIHVCEFCKSMIITRINFPENSSNHCLIAQIITDQCGNYGNLLSCIFSKNFVKVTYLLNSFNLTKIFFSDRQWIFNFSTLCLTEKKFRQINYLHVYTYIFFI